MAIRNCPHCSALVDGRCEYCPVMGIFSDAPRGFSFDDEQSRMVLADWYGDCGDDWKEGILRREFEPALQSWIAAAIKVYGMASRQRDSREGYVMVSFGPGPSAPRRVFRFHRQSGTVTCFNRSSISLYDRNNGHDIFRKDN